MFLTIGNWILTGVVFVIGVGVSIFIATENSKKAGLINMAVVVALCIGIVALFNWYNTSTASGIRNYKDFQSEMANGIYREITITAEDGREIFHYEGKFDLERHEDGDDRYLRFETQDGKRYTISYGIQDTVLIIEKDAPTESTSTESN